jgi:hypothetical protein
VLRGCATVLAACEHLTWYQALKIPVTNVHSWWDNGETRFQNMAPLQSYSHTLARNIPLAHTKSLPGMVIGTGDVSIFLGFVAGILDVEVNDVILYSILIITPYSLSYSLLVSTYNQEPCALGKLVKFTMVELESIFFLS